MKPHPSGLRPFRQGFTLMELLAVISIITILASLTLATVQYARNAAKAANANSTINSIALALRCYYEEYQRWPPDDDTGALPAEVPLTNQKLQNLMLILTGTDCTLTTATAGVGGNARRISFLELKPVDKKVVSDALSGPDYEGVYKQTSGGTYTNIVDPWGFSYMVCLGTNYNNTVANVFGRPDVAGGTSTVPPIKFNFAIWCAGKDHMVDPAETSAIPTLIKNKDNITSW